jgi:hypothetical protein
MITVVDGKLTKIYQSPRLSKKYIASFIVVAEWAAKYPELARHYTNQPGGTVGRTFDVFEGWGCRLLEHYPGQQGIHVGRYLGEDV